MKKYLNQRVLFKCLDIVVPLLLIILEITLNFVCMCTALNCMCLVFFIGAITSPIWLGLLFVWWPIILFGLCVARIPIIRKYVTV